MKVYEEGWVCPKCGAVMSPREKVCINCKGILTYKWTCDENIAEPYKPNSRPYFDGDEIKCVEIGDKK